MSLKLYWKTKDNKNKNELNQDYREWGNGKIQGKDWFPEGEWIN